MFLKCLYYLRGRVCLNSARLHGNSELLVRTTLEITFYSPEVCWGKSILEDYTVGFCFRPFPPPYFPFPLTLEEHGSLTAKYCAPDPAVKISCLYPWKLLSPARMSVK